MFPPANPLTKIIVHGCVWVRIGEMALLAANVVKPSVLLAGIERIAMLNMTDRVFRARMPSHKIPSIQQVESHTIKTPVGGNVRVDSGGMG